jgi:hypothetical protein
MVAAVAIDASTSETPNNSTQVLERRMTLPRSDSALLPRVAAAAQARKGFLRRFTVF